MTATAIVEAPAVRRHGPFTGTLVLARMALRRDRVRTPAWAVSFTLLFIFTASAWDSLYPTAAERKGLAATLGASPALTALLGPLFDPISTGGLTVWRLGSIAALILGLVNIFLVVRHSRAEEQDGRAELMLSAVTGRCAPLAAALVAAAALDVLFVVLVVLTLSVQLGFMGTLTMASTIAVVAFVFAGVAAVMVQVARTGRGANGLASLVTAITFAMAAAANASSSSPEGPLLWLSPFAWVQQTQAYVENRWWVIVLAKVVALTLCAASLAVAARRDLGAGLAPARKGRPAAAGWVGSAWSLAWRLDRASLLAWLAGAAAYGVLVGWLVQTAVDVIETSPQLGQFIEQLGGAAGVADSYVVLMSLFFALVASAFGVSTVLRLHADEASGRAELLLSTPVSRWAWVGGRVITAFVGSMLILVVGGTLLGSVYGAASSDVVNQAGRYGTAALLAVPAVWVVIGLAIALIGWLPREAWAPWLVLTWFGVVAVLGAALGLPNWLQAATPFWYSSTWPIEPLQVLPVVGLLATAGLLVAAGLIGARRRDIPA